MNRRIALILAVTMAGAARLSAQEVSSVGPGTVEVTVIPGGGTFFTTGSRGPSFGNYTVGAALTYNITRIVGIEGEADGTLGLTQDLQLGGITASAKTPDLINYAANLVVAAPTHTSLVPYVTGGVGGLTMLERTGLGVNTSRTFLTGNVGGGLKWYAPNGRWGLRGDYRFVTVASNDTAPAFFGQDTRYGHRVYGAVVINAVR